MRIKEITPWWLKIALKIILTRLPIDYTFWQKIGIFRHGKMDQSAYIKNNFDGYCHSAKIGYQNLNGKTILELGPGDSIGTALIASSFGAKTIMIDAGQFAVDDLSIYCKLANNLRQKGIDVPNIEEAPSFRDILDICNAEYLTRGLKDLSNLENNSVDMIVSQAVLEHIRLADFSKTIDECSRVMKEDGFSVHSVDLKDHLGRALNNLRFSEDFWESDFIAKSGFYTNRIRYSEMLDIFRKSGLNIDVIKQSKWDVLPTPKGSLSPPFDSLNYDELLISDFTVLLRHAKTPN